MPIEPHRLGCPMLPSPAPPLSIVVWANILDVNRYLTNIVNIALCLPDLTEVCLAEQADQVALISRRFGARSAGCGLDHRPGRTEWHLEGPVAYTGTILAFGDSSISQLRSTLQAAAAEGGAGEALLHVRFLRELADRIEAGAQSVGAGHRALQHS